MYMCTVRMYVAIYVHVSLTLINSYIVWNDDMYLYIARYIKIGNLKKNRDHKKYLNKIKTLV